MARFCLELIFIPMPEKSDVGGEILAGDFYLPIQLSFCVPTEEYSPGPGTQTL